MVAERTLPSLRKGVAMGPQSLKSPTGDGIAVKPVLGVGEGHPHLSPTCLGLATDHDLVSLLSWVQGRCLMAGWPWLLDPSRIIRPTAPKPGTRR